MMAGSTVEVLVPTSVQPGDSLNVATDGGIMFTIIVPAGVKPGQKLLVLIPEGASGRTINEPLEDNHFGTETPEYMKSEVGRSSNVVTVGAAVATAVVGTLVAGPLIGIIFSGLAVYACTRDDKIGQVARLYGNFACAGYEKCNEFATRNQIPDRCMAAVNKTASKLTEVNSEYKVTDRIYSFGSSLVVQAEQMSGRNGSSSSHETERPHSNDLGESGSSFSSSGFSYSRLPTAIDEENTMAASINDKAT